MSIFLAHVWSRLDLSFIAVHEVPMPVVLSPGLLLEGGCFLPSLVPRLCTQGLIPITGYEQQADSGITGDLLGFLQEISKRESHEGIRQVWLHRSPRRPVND